MPEVTEALKPSILVEAIRAKLLDGLAEVDPFAEARRPEPSIHTSRWACRLSTSAGRRMS
jgi:hypothetical protein